MPKINELSTEPLYPIKTVSAQTGIQPITLRAWERRYKLLAPQRGDNRYRLYSDQDIAILTWVKARVDGEMQISAAARLVDQMRASGSWAEVNLPAQPAPIRETDEPAEKFIQPLYQALYGKKEQDALAILNEVREKYELEELFSGILIPVLVQIGEAWFDGRIGVSTEHFASTLLRGWVTQIYYTLPARTTGRRILVGTGPDETHEIGQLMFACLLRQKGSFVDYIGPDNPLEDLVDYAEEQNAFLVILSASIDTNALELKKVQEKLARLPKPPLFAYGGQAFNLFPELRKAIPGIFLGSTMSEGLQKIQELVKESK